MRIKELIRELQKYPEDNQVFLASDSKGNSFSTISGNSFTEDQKLTEKKGFIIIYPHGEGLDYYNLN